MGDRMAVGTKVSMSRTISESDVYIFGGLTGDLGRNHVDEVYSQRTMYGRRVVHGAYLVGLASAAATLYGQRYDKGPFRGASYGYDRIRFVRPVFIGDTVTLNYEITDMDEISLRSIADVTGTFPDGTVCFVAVHISQGLPPERGDDGQPAYPRGNFDA